MKKTPTNESLKAAHYAAQELARQNAAPVRWEFMIDEDGKGFPPIARMIRGGRGGEVRLKLFLSMLWLGPRRPANEMAFRSGFWAELLELDDPSGAGARRVSDAISWLEQQNFIRATRRPGYFPCVTLLDERGTGARYQHPRRYIKIPAEFWTRRWIQDMSGAAVVFFLVVLAELRRKGPRPSFWLAPRLAREIYGLSADTWTKGGAELSRLGLVSIGRERLRDEHVESVKKRNTYRLATAAILPGSLEWRDLEAALLETLRSRGEPIADLDPGGDSS